MEGYLRAASRVTALAVGDVAAEASEARYRVPKTASQLTRVDRRLKALFWHLAERWAACQLTV